MIWDTVQSHRRRGNFWAPRIAKQAGLPVEAIMGPLGACEHATLPRFLRRESRRETHLDALLPQQLHASPPMLPSGPIAPEQRSRSPLAGMQQKTDSARMFGLLPMPLALFAQGAGPAIRDPSLIDQTEAAISL